MEQQTHFNLSSGLNVVRAFHVLYVRMELWVIWSSRKISSRMAQPCALEKLCLLSETGTYGVRPVWEPLPTLRRSAAAYADSKYESFSTTQSFHEQPIEKPAEYSGFVLHFRITSGSQHDLAKHAVGSHCELWRTNWLLLPRLPSIQS